MKIIGFTLVGPPLRFWPARAIRSAVPALALLRRAMPRVWPSVASPAQAHACRSRTWTRRARLPRLPGHHAASVHRRRRAVLRPALGSRADQTRAPPHAPLTCCLVPLPLAQQQQCSGRLPPHAHAPSSELARPTTEARRRPLHLALSSSSTSCISC